MAKIRVFLRKCPAIFLLFFVFSSFLFPDAQEALKTLKGRLTNENGEPMPGASIEIRNTVSGHSLTAITDELGQFIFQNVDLGSYELNLTVQGFRTLSYDNLVIGRQNRATSIALEACLASIEITGGTAPYPEYPEVTLSKNLSWSPPSSLNLPEKEILCQKDGFFHSSTGIAKIGIIPKKLDKFTQIPTDDSQYKCDGLLIEEGCVYALKADYSKKPVMILIKVESLSNDSVKFQYYVSKSPGQL